MAKNKRKIGAVSFTCLETGQVATMDITLDGQNISMKPHFKIPLNEDVPLSVTMELWNRWTGHIHEAMKP